jgi:hypothetical protein
LPVRFNVDVQCLEGGSGALRRKRQCALSIPAYLVHLLRTEKLGGIDPALDAFRRTNLYEPATDVQNANAITVLEYSDRAVLLSELAAKIY